jgi:SNF2 family DNA or RNA helicase
MDVDQGAPAQQLDTQSMAISQNPEAPISNEADQSNADSSPAPRLNDDPVDGSESSLWYTGEDDNQGSESHKPEEESDIRMMELIGAELANDGLVSETPRNHPAQRVDNILKQDEDAEDSKLNNVNDINESDHNDAETVRNDDEPTEAKEPEDDTVPEKDIKKQGHSDDVKDAEAPETTEAEGSQKKYQKAKGEPRKMARNPKEYFAKHRAKESTRKRKGTDTDSSRASKMLKENNWKDDKPSGVRSMLINGAGEDFERSFGSGEAPSMGTISAKTHKAQFDQLKAQIPPDCDMRRASSQVKDLEEAKKVFGFKRISAVNRNFLLKGMRTALFPYQMTLVAWMAKRECGDCTPFGGIVGDEMGMGKTVVSLFLIDGNPPSQEEIEDHCRATLVVVPNAAIAKQWQAEAEAHSSPATANRTIIFRRSNDTDLESTKEQSIV